MGANGVNTQVCDPAGSVVLPWSTPVDEHEHHVEPAFGPTFSPDFALAMFST